MESQRYPERYAAYGTRHNPAYMPDDVTDKVYNYNPQYHQARFSDSHRSFSTLSQQKDDVEVHDKEDRSLISPVCLCITFLAIALVIAAAVVIVVMIVVVDDGITYADVLVVGESSTRGEITLTDMTWDSHFANSSSQVYKTREKKFLEEMDITYRRSNLANVYISTTVEQFRQGSVIVDFWVHLNGATPSAKQIKIGENDEQLQEEVESATASDVLSVLNSETEDNHLGDIPVGEASVTEVSVTFEVENGNPQNQPGETEPPLVTCPNDITTNTDEGSALAVVSWEDPVAEDNSGEVDHIESEPESGSEFRIGETEVSVLAYDAAGNIGVCTFIVTVVDNEPPVLTCPSDVYNQTQMGELSGYVTWVIPHPTDNSGDSVTFTIDQQPGEYKIGTYEVNAEATDSSGNTAMCSFMVVIEPLCYPDFCLNKGTCSFSTPDNAYVCKCPESILGKNCEFEIPGVDACGISSLSPSTRIVGGEIAHPGSWPWQAFLEYRSYLCGATLITNQWVVTAAHCVGDPGYRANLDAIILGEVHLTDKSVSRVYRPVERIAVHPGYQSFAIDNDVALIQLAEPVEFDDFVSPVCLPSNSNVKEEDVYSKCYATGWGQTHEFCDISMDLLQAEVPLINMAVCNQKLKALGNQPLTENMICAGTDEKSTCTGDNGGPLVCQEADGRWTLVGITSWGYQCGEPESPSVFVRVSKFLEYIESVINGNPVVSCELVNSGCEMIIPYTETFTTTQSQVENFVDSLYRDYFPGPTNPLLCDVDRFNGTICSIFFRSCDEGIVPCREYCEKIHRPCTQDDYICTFLPYGPPGEQWCAEGRDYCGEQNIRLSKDITKILTSPFFGSYNRANRDCIWIITGPVGYSIVVRIEFLFLESDTNTLSVGYGSDPDRRSSTVKKLFDQSQAVLVADHQGWIRFETSNDVYYRGFSAQLLVMDTGDVALPCMNHSLVCSNLCLPEDWICDGIRDCEEGEDEAGCTKTDYSLDVFLTEDDPYFFILSPKYYEYPPNLNATWLFTCPKDFIIRITFLLVDTEACCDIIVVSDETGQALVRWSGFMQYEKLFVTSRGNTLHVSFQTDDDNDYYGFGGEVELLNYTGGVSDCGRNFDCGQGVCLPYSGVCNDFINCLEAVDETCSEHIFVNTSYIFQSPNHPLRYPDNILHTWYFYKEHGSQLLITFGSFATEFDGDYVYIKEGNNIDGPSELLLQFSGVALANKTRVLSSKDIIWVTIENDGLGALTGFSATVEVTDMTREELNCGSEFDCKNGACIPQRRVCNGERECGNNVDERNENCTVTCNPYDFTCDDGYCVDSYDVCDGYPHCTQGEDESVCSGTEHIFVDSSYSFNSPYFPSTYPENFYYVWYFHKEPTSQLLITFGAISTEPNYDLIYVREGNNISYMPSELLLEFSGTAMADEIKILSSDEIIYVTFTSNWRNAYTGFNATVEVTSMTREELDCGTGFDCKNGVCLPQGRICDQSAECGNYADEIAANCTGDCGPSEFTCKDGSCIPESYRCDRYRDCLGGEDESSCPSPTCSPSQFTCDNGGCIPDSFRCDYYHHCAGGEDEFGCANLTCSPSEFTCDDGYCFPEYYRCDGYPDCAGEEDEFDCANSMLSEDDQVYIVSPNYPNDYPKSLDFSWRISTVPGNALEMKFISFQTKRSDDFITIDEFDGFTFAPLIKKWSGNDTSLQVSTSTHQMRVNFHSDDSVNDGSFQGFQGIIRSVPKNATFSCPDSYFDCGNGACFSMNAVCDVEVHCGNGADEGKSCAGRD